MRKWIPYICCIILTACVIFGSLFLPQAGFVFIDKAAREEIYTEAANEGISGKAVSVSDKLSTLANMMTGISDALVRVSDVFLPTGKEIAQDDLLSVIKREAPKIDPFDVFGLSALEENASVTSARLNNVMDTDKSFPLWFVEVTTNTYLFSFCLDAVSGKIYVAARSGKLVTDAEEMLPPDQYTEETEEAYFEGFANTLSAFSRYLGYDTFTYAEYLEYGDFYIMPEDEKFILSVSFTDVGMMMAPLWTKADADMTTDDLF